MHSSFFVAIILSFLQSILAAHVEDDRIIIGSSIGGVVGLVSFIFDDKEKD